MVVQRKKTRATAGEEIVNEEEVREEVKPESPPPPAAPEVPKPIPAAKAPRIKADVILEFDLEYTEADLYYNLDTVVKEQRKKARKTPTRAAVLPPKLHRTAPRAKSMQRTELSPKTKLIIAALLVALLLPVYPAWQYYKSYKAEQLIKELDRIKKYREWQAKEQKRLERERYEKPARDYVTKTQDYIAEADKLNVEKYSKEMYLRAKGFLTLAQESLNKEEWQKAYENANSSIIAIDKAKADAEVARKEENELKEKEQLVAAREKLTKDFGDLVEKFKAQAEVAAESIAEMDNVNAKSYYPIPYEESRTLYQQAVDKSSKELQEWSSVKDKDIDEVLNKRVEIMKEALSLMQQAEKRSKEAATLTRNKKILEQKEKMRRTLEKKEQEDERMRKLKEERMKIKQ